MPYFELNRDHVLATAKGHIISFVEGEKTWVPPECTQDVIAIGGKRLGAEEKLAVAPAFVEPQGEERDEAFKTAFELLVSKNERGDFTGTGVPTAKALKELLGFSADKGEIATRWTAFSAK
jgi:hypothetical protein